MEFFGRRSSAGPDAAHRLLDTPGGPAPEGYTPGEPVDGEVAVHFADDPRKLYQLKQWLPVFELLDERHHVVVVLRDPATLAELSALTPLRCVLAPAVPDLIDLYEISDFKVAVYVNNSGHNFESLTQRRIQHVHVNHGESDKVCMVSNQVKAYDRVFVAGPNAVARHRAALMSFDHDKLVPVGRPQLDLRPAPLLAPTDRRTVLYAPTWEGENASNNYTSVDVFGPEIVAAALAVPDVRVVYKPHPRVPLSPLPSMVDSHDAIVRLVEDAARRDPDAGHQVRADGDILAVFPGCDLIVTDVSSVGLDFLYLRPEQPMFIADRREDRARLLAEAPIAAAADIVDSTTLAALTATITDRLAADARRADRRAARRGYFGDLGPGESTARFLDAVTETAELRDRELALLAEARTSTPGRSA
ncbi:CDP-glycerol glycerophosphotransferase family protein [Actinokineospora sp. G85]|uniref:CDP-glycerol glycerophosphotransferase family protein n=1 Tax=Actinokineospora sp. G85 TaxID=3406626 RepID=UPI003C79223E